MFPQSLAIFVESSLQLFERKCCQKFYSPRIFPLNSKNFPSVCLVFIFMKTFVCSVIDKSFFLHKKFSQPLSKATDAGDGRIKKPRLTKKHLHLSLRIFMATINVCVETLKILWKLHCSLTKARYWQNEKVKYWWSSDRNEIFCSGKSNFLSWYYSSKDPCQSAEKKFRSFFSHVEKRKGNIWWHLLD